MGDGSQPITCKYNASLWGPVVPFVAIQNNVQQKAFNNGMLQFTQYMKIEIIDHNVKHKAEPKQDVQMGFDASPLNGLDLRVADAASNDAPQDFDQYPDLDLEVTF